MFGKIYDILVSFLGESRRGYYSEADDQYQFDCPWETEENGYPDGKKNCEVSFRLGKFHCWCCDNAGPISKLVRKFGGDELLRQYYDALNEIRETKYLNPEFFSSETSIFSDDRRVMLPSTFRKIDLSTCRNAKLVEYLNSRRIDQEIIDRYNIGVTGWDNEKPKYKHRVIVPSYDENGILSYWSGRDYTGKSMSKYWNADGDVNAPNKSDVVFNEKLINYDADITLVEGTFDSIYSPNTIAMLGKVVTRDFEIYRKINERLNANLTICLDADTDIEETKKIYRLFNNGRLNGRVWYLRLNKCKDFGEVYEKYGRDGIIGVMKTRRKFHEIDI